MKLRRQLHLCFAAVGLVVACAGIFGLHELNKLIAAYDGAVAGYRQAQDVDLLQSSFKTQVQEWNNTLLRKDGTARATDWQAFQDGERRVAAQVAKLLGVLPAGRERALIAQFGRAHAQMGQDCRKGYAQFEARGFEAAAGDADVDGKERGLSGLLEQASDAILAETAHKVAAATAGSRRATLFSLVATVLGAATAILAGILVSRSIVRGRAVGVANTIADPDPYLATRIEVDSNELHAAWDEPVSAARMALRALPPVCGKRGTPARVAGDWQAT
jgi:hypothetical protein